MDPVDHVSDGGAYGGFRANISEQSVFGSDVAV